MRKSWLRYIVIALTVSNIVATFVYLVIHFDYCALSYVQQCSSVFGTLQGAVSVVAVSIVLLIVYRRLERVETKVRSVVS